MMRFVQKGRTLFWKRYQAISSVFNSLPNNKTFDLSKLKAFADNKISVSLKRKFVLERVEIAVGKGENAGYQHFLLFPHCFQKAVF